MTIVIMQPYFLPYIGYFQLIKLADTFVIYDDVQFIKGGWINRNRLIKNGSSKYISIPLSKSSYSEIIKNRTIHEKFSPNSILDYFKQSYNKSPFFNQAYYLLKEIMLHENQNLSQFVINSLKVINEELEIVTKMKISSQLPFDRGLKGQERVIAICKSLKARKYVNPIGGTALYDKSTFDTHGIELKFHKSKFNAYDQNGYPFMNNLSIIDTIAFCGVPNTMKRLEDFELIDG